MTDYLEQLSNAFGVSSVEDQVRDIILKAAKPLVDASRVDTMGNLFLTRRAKSSAGKPPLRVMVTAHMDEVGFMISKITSSGLLKFKPVGGFDKRILLGKQVVVGPDQIPGVIGLKPTHLLSSAEDNKVGSLESMTIDIGANDDRAGGKIKPGDFATFAATFGRLGGQARPRKDRGLVKGKALDNRAGCAVMMELLKADYPVELVAVFTVQEEIGLRGAKVAAYAANPDLAFIMECTAADDLPPIDDDSPAHDASDKGIPQLGAGPAITVMDGTFIADRRLIDLLIDTAKAESISYQYKRPGIGGTDAGAVHLAREGIPSAVVSIPARYIHAPAAILDLADFWRTVNLMKATLQRLPAQDPTRERLL